MTSCKTRSKYDESKGQARELSILRQVHGGIKKNIEGERAPRHHGRGRGRPPTLNA